MELLQEVIVFQQLLRDLSWQALSTAHLQEHQGAEGGGVQQAAQGQQLPVSGPDMS